MADQIINVPGVGQVNFPASMSDADIENAIKTQILPQAKGEAKVAGPNDAVNTFANSTAQHSTFGFADEIGAAVRAAMPGFSNWMMAPPAVKREGDQEATPQTVSTAPDFSGRYSEELANLRKQTAVDKEAHPIANAAGAVTGALATAPLLPGMSPGASLIGNTLKYAGTGAALGGLQGFGEGEGGFGNRLDQAKVGATVGAVGGAVLPIAGMGVSKVADEFAAPGMRKLADVLDRFAPKATPQSLSAAAPDGAPIIADSLAGRGAEALRSGADKIEENVALRNIASAVAKQKTSPEALAAQLEKLGPNATLSDLGEGLVGQANAARLESPEVKALAQQVMGERAKQYTPMLSDAFTGGADVPSLYRAGQAFDANASQVGHDLYGAMRAQGLTVSPEMEALQKVPAVQDALAQIQADAASTGKTLDPVEIMHRVKQKLNDTATAAFASGKPINKADMGDLANQWEQAFYQANPAAKAADQGYAVAKSLPDYADMGRRFMSEGTTPGQLEVSHEAVADKLAEALQQQKGAYTLGVQNAGRAAAQANPTAFARRLTPEMEGIVSKLEQAVGPDQTQQILRSANAVRTFQATSNRLTGGSSSVPNVSDIAAFNHARIGIGKSGVFESLRERLGEALGEIEQPSERTTGKIGEMLLTRDPEENARVLNMIADLLSKSRHHTAAAAVGANTANSVGGR